MPSVITAVRGGTLALVLLACSARVTLAQVELLPLNATYRYLVSSNGAMPSGAEDPGFDDTAFSTGPAPFGFSIPNAISWGLYEGLTVREHLALSDSPMGAVLSVHFLGYGSFYINGALVAQLAGCGGAGSDFQTIPLCDGILHSGDNVFVASCIASCGGAYFDATITADPPDPTVTAVPESTTNDGVALFEPNMPNPFVGSTEIRFSLARVEKVTLKVFDVSGREVQSLADGLYGTGAHVLRWDGKDSSGNAISNGVYFFEFRTRDFTKRGKMVLAR